MSLHGFQSFTLGNEEILMRRTSNGLGISYAGLEGSLGGDAHRVIVRVIIPRKVNVDVRFAVKPTGETI